MLSHLIGSWELSSMGLGVPMGPPFVKALMNILTTAALLAFWSSSRQVLNKTGLSFSKLNPCFSIAPASGASAFRWRHSFWKLACEKWDIILLDRTAQIENSSWKFYLEKFDVKCCKFVYFAECCWKILNSYKFPARYVFSLFRKLCPVTWL